MRIQFFIIFFIFFIINNLSFSASSGFILTGGPGTGKTTLIRELEFRGKNVVYEVAEQYIKLNKVRTKKVGVMSPQFDLDVATAQIKREDFRFLNNLNQDIFIDRSVFDNLAFIKYYNKDTSKNFFKIINERKQNFHKFYKIVFIIENLGKSFVTDFRQEDLKASIKIEVILEDIYTELGAKIVRIPPATVEERVEMILSTIRQFKNS